MKKKKRRRRRQVRAVDDFNSFSETLHCYLVISPSSALPETLTITLLSHSKMRISECVFLFTISFCWYTDFIDQRNELPDEGELRRPHHRTVIRDDPQEDVEGLERFIQQRYGRQVMM